MLVKMALPVPWKPNANGQGVAGKEAADPRLADRRADYAHMQFTDTQRWD
jgi:hypothetical protein